MIKIIAIFFSLILISNCSFNSNSRIWNDQKNEIEQNENIVEIFGTKEVATKEFNSNISIDFSDTAPQNLKYNNFGSYDYKARLEKVEGYRFSKFNSLDGLNSKPLFLKDGLIYFDKKGALLRFDQNSKVIWKNNFYSKSEKKLNPILSLALDENNLVIVDNISKVYSVNLNTGELNWSKNNPYPFNSEIKIHNESFFAIDFNNTLRCFKIIDGSECWNLATESSFTISNTDYSLAIIDNQVIFNNSIGDITAVDISSGLIIWQLPTQSSNIINQTYNFKLSNLVSDGKSIFFSNNRNEFYSVDIKTGSLNWKNDISSKLTPIILDEFILTISEDGHLFTIQKEQGNILRINDIYSLYKAKKRKDIKPEGFVIANNKIFLTNNNGHLIVINLKTGKIEQIKKIAREKISKPYIFNQHLYLVKNGTIVKYD
ncbi:PQQ-binding-like beta-propeller repeat protein [Candidatus Pelagibacter sp.]|uniref:PQQ-binding-like beta-propeller repeat protein n=1 Tax=Candidatus Pelagibacter sp. TaxID=2024849 RepID=UPI003F8375F2